jgi:hypothetical protein
MLKKLLFCTMSVTLLMQGAACSSSTRIQSTNQKAKIYVNGEFLGEGQGIHTDTKIVGSRNEVRLEAPGCRPQMEFFARNEEFSVGALIGGIFLLIPFLWIMDYKPSRTYEYNCVKS